MDLAEVLGNRKSIDYAYRLRDNIPALYHYLCQPDIDLFLDTCRHLICKEPVLEIEFIYNTNAISMKPMLSINCKEAGDPNCSHTITGNTEQELFENAKKHAMETHGMTAEQFDEDAKKNEDKYKKLIRQT